MYFYLAPFSAADEAMANSWSRAKRAFGLNLCVSIPQTEDIDEDGPRTAEAATGGRRDSTAAAFPADSSRGGSTAMSELQPRMPTTPNPSSGGLRLLRSLSRSTKVRTFMISICFVLVIGYSSIW